MSEDVWIYGRQPVRLALAAGALRRPLRLCGTRPGLAALGHGSRFGGLEAEWLESRALERLTGSREHQGVAALVPAYPYADPEELVGADLVVALDEVSDPRNLGAVVRSALAAGASGVVVTRHRASHVTPAAVKASAGATEHLPVARVTNLVTYLKCCQRAGAWVYGATADAVVPYTTLNFKSKVVLVFGSEGRGLRRLVAESCDELAALPMNGPLDSINVSAAAAVFLFEARRQRTPTGSGSGD